MKAPILIALLIVPLIAGSAEARGGGHGHHHHHHHLGAHGGHHRGHARVEAGHHHGRHGTGPRRVHHGRRATLPAREGAVYAMVTNAAIEHGLPPALAHGIVRVESGYNCAARNGGASGIMQVKAATARSVGVSGSLRSCAAGLEAGMRYLRQAYEVAHGNAAVAATLYNRGLGARPSRSGYSRNVMRFSAL